MEHVELRVAQRGIITLPKTLRDSYGIKPGDTLTLIDLEGIFVLSPRRSEIDARATKIANQWAEDGVTLEDMLQALREERARRDNCSKTVVAHPPNKPVWHLSRKRATM